ncbi:MAG: hypothetical protein HYX55_07350 [Chloroflexi bacterium]|nr:hypothetical protein [Chloroflexota bacterium]
MHRRSPRILQAAALALIATATIAGSSLAAGKPGYPDRVSWGGISWQVKTSNAAVGPGPNVFSSSNVSVAAGDKLHLQIQKDSSGRWTTAEIIGPTSYGYGTYTFTVGSPVNALDRNVVLGLFTWSDRAPYAHREIDFEAARWGNAADTTNAQFVVQPYDVTGHLVRFDATAAVRTKQQFTWSAGRASFLSTNADTGAEIYRYTYTGADVPKPGDERVHLNLWLFGGAAPSNGAPVDVVIESFQFAP